MYDRHMTLREVSNVPTLDFKDRLRYAASHAVAPPAPSSARHSSGPVTRLSSGSTRLSSFHFPSPGYDRAHRDSPSKCGEISADIVDMFHLRERTVSRDPNYLTAQTEVTEKMRTILVDWLVDVHLKFKLHPETLFLAVDIVDRYLSVARVGRSQLQLVGVTAMLLAAKYEEIWPPEVKECIHISANTYTRDELLRMERAICGTLSFKLTVPTPFPFLSRLLETTDADEKTRCAAVYFLEFAAQDYKNLQYLPSQLANAAMYLANVLHRKPDPWNATLVHYSRSRLSDFQHVARGLLEYAVSLQGSKYTAVSRKYSTAKYQEVGRLSLPVELPADL